MKLNTFLISSLAFSVKIWILDQLGSKIILGFLMSIFGLLFLIYYGYLDGIPYIKQKKQMFKGASVVYSLVTNLLSNFSTSNKSGKIEREAAHRKFKSKLVEEVHLEKHGKSYRVYLPKDVDVIEEMIKYKVYLVGKKGEHIDITHPPGIAYMVTAYHLGGEKIIVKEKSSGKLVYEYDETTIPSFYYDYRDEITEGEVVGNEIVEIDEIPIEVKQD